MTIHFTLERMSRTISRTESLSFTWEHQVHLKFTKPHHDAISVYNTLGIYREKNGQYCETTKGYAHLETKLLQIPE